ncbi:zinc-dependent alcohol dehydrogenase family protein [Roseobacter sp.]|uniref:zinc-dependent alcohol dehydrogenase family protein n=1 Tax=Roseobacter sp. TaxID=1907202 RepID=UPI0025EACF25|nr:zinc-dependent alcohol dehydrogenase family protein [Roseobacter sp.]
MLAMVLNKGETTLRARDVPAPDCGPRQVRLRVEACGVCRTDLHIIDAELKNPVLPLIPGHEIVGRIIQSGDNVEGFTTGQRVGVPWLGKTCGSCPYCLADRENLCDAPGFTGYTLNGGYAEECVADAGYVFALSEDADPVRLAPLLCAGLIGYRSYTMAADAQRLGFYGFGAAAHILAQIAVWQGRDVYAFTQPGDIATQRFARRKGAVWAGGSDMSPGVSLDAAIIFAPVGKLVPQALKAIRKGGRVICAGIHMSDIPSFPYADLWHERQIMSVANLTRGDGDAFFALADKAGVRTETTPYPLRDANKALDDLRNGRLNGAAVLVP